jgi:hypothetical protein
MTPGVVMFRTCVYEFAVRLNKEILDMLTEEAPSTSMTTRFDRWMHGMCIGAHQYSDQEPMLDL